MGCRMSEESSTQALSVKRRHKDALCEVCPLYKSGTIYVASSGPKDAKIALVGEAPGQSELRTGIPFSGQSGQLLNTVLEHHGIDRNEVLVTNAVLCMVKGDNVKPPKAAIKACRPRLLAEINNVETVLALGNYAAQTILNTSEGVTKLRPGPPKQLTTGQRIIPTLHPAYCLRSPAQFPLFVNDIGKVKLSSESQWVDPIYKVYDDFGSAIRVIAQLKAHSSKSLTTDIETAEDKDDYTGRPSTILCVGLGGYERGKCVVLGSNAVKHPKVMHALYDMLRTKENVAHNGKFDFSVLNCVPLHFDTMLSSYCFNENPGVHRLKYRIREDLGGPEYDIEFNRSLGTSRTYDTAPRDILYWYNAHDVVGTDLLRERDIPELERLGLRKLHDFLVEWSNALAPVEVEGVCIDLEYSIKLDIRYRTKLAELESHLKEWVDNPRSWQQIKRALLEGFEVDTASTDKAHRDAIIKMGYAVEFLEPLNEYKRLQKLHGTYIKGVLDRQIDGRVYPTYKLHGTTTGRPSCANPNLLNVARDLEIRRMYVPPPGHVFVQADYSQVEMRVMGVESDDETLLAILNDPNRDIHGEVTEIAYGPGWTQSMRTNTKRVVFGGSYGAGVPTVAVIADVSESEAARILLALRKMTPGVQKWKKDIKHRVLVEQEDLETPFGRRLRTYLITRENAHEIEKSAYAFSPQSIASDICVRAFIRLRRAGINVKLPVYDSITAEVPKEAAEETAKIMREVMEESGREYSTKVTFPVEIKIDTSWAMLEKEP